jgi:hypothetical protein
LEIGSQTPIEDKEVFYFMSTTQKLTEQLAQFVFLDEVNAGLIADYITRKYTLTEIQEESESKQTIFNISIKDIVYEFDKVLEGPTYSNYRIHPKEPRCFIVNNIVVCSIDLLKELPFERIKKHKNSLDKFQDHEYFGEYYDIVDKIYIEKHISLTDDGRVTDITEPTSQQLFGG